MSDCLIPKNKIWHACVCLGLQGQLLKWARGVATEHFESLLSGGGGVGLRYQLAHKLVLGRLLVKLGLDRLERGIVVDFLVCFLDATLMERF